MNNTIFDKKLHLSMFLLHEAHKNTKHEHAMNMIYVKSMYIKNRSLEIVTNSKAPSMVVFPTKAP